MEDTHFVLEDLPHGLKIYAVFDGHLGRDIALFLCKHFKKMFLEQEAFLKKDWK